ncbi:MAG: cardiolipin synthase, partial [Spirochaetaceae bacterium]
MPLADIQFWPAITAITGILLSLAASIHALLYKRDSRSTIAWVGVIWLAPISGAILYALLGINRVKRKVHGRFPVTENQFEKYDHQCQPKELIKLLPTDRQHLSSMAKIGDQLTSMPLMQGNRITPLINGDEAYPAMLEAIQNSQKSISLTTYIFDNDHIGKKFVDALAYAKNRGVEVRVVIDAVGRRYSIPPINNALKKAGVPCVLFMPTLVPWAMPYMNLRNHRKIMIVDGKTGFAGGMNTRSHHMLSTKTRHPTRDIHFMIQGPVVRQLQKVFADDLQFNSHEVLSGSKWFPEIDPCGQSLIRAIPDGPDVNLDRIRHAYLGAVNLAQKKVTIITPYFLPDATLISALNTSSMKGVKIDIIIPEHNNQKMVAWAANAQLWQLLIWNCNVYLSPKPFDHSKVMVIDDFLCLLGSANWDPRSLRLNFELG